MSNGDGTSSYGTSSASTGYRRNGTTPDSSRRPVNAWPGSGRRPDRTRPFMPTTYNDIWKEPEVTVIKPRREREKRRCKSNEPCWEV